MIHPWVAFLTWKFTSIFILATAFLFCLSDEVAHSLTSVENLQQNPTINNWKFAFCASHSRCLMKWYDTWRFKKALANVNFYLSSFLHWKYPLGQFLHLIVI